jgi:hypothetical protein
VDFLIASEKLEEQPQVHFVGTGGSGRSVQVNGSKEKV